MVGGDLGHPLVQRQLLALDPVEPALDAFELLARGTAVAGPFAAGSAARLSSYGDAARGTRRRRRAGGAAARRRAAPTASRSPLEEIPVVADARPACPAQPSSRSSSSVRVSTSRSFVGSSSSSTLARPSAGAAAAAAAARHRTGRRPVSTAASPAKPSRSSSWTRGELASARRARCASHRLDGLAARAASGSSSATSCDRYAGATVVPHCAPGRTSAAAHRRAAAAASSCPRR